MKRYILIIGTFDTKGEELTFLRDQILSRSQSARTLDAGVLQPSPPNVDISNEKVASAGGKSLRELVQQRDRGRAVAAMTRGAARIAQELFAKGEIRAIISLGGGARERLSARAQ